MENNSQIQSEIIRAAQQLASRVGGYAGLADVKEWVQDMTDATDAQWAEAIVHLAEHGGNHVIIVPEDNQKTLTPRDRAAAVRFGPDMVHLISVR